MSGVDKMAEALGVRRETYLELARKVRLNNERLRACTGHQFHEIPGTWNSGLGTRYRCAHCTGEVDAHAHHWFTMGQQHARAAA